MVTERQNMSTFDNTQHRLNNVEDGRIAEIIENWKGKLVDLSKRNKARNFKPTKVTTIPVIDESPSEIFKQFYILNQRLHFGFKKISALPSEPVLTDESLDEMDEIDHMDFLPYESTGSSNRLVDKILQTSLSAEALDNSLRRIAEQATLSIQEQGINTLFLSLGMLYYTESTDSEDIIKAPIVLLPVELKRSNARSQYSIKATDDDPIVNPTLVEYLNRSYGIALPDIPSSSDITEDYNLQQLFSEVEELISNQKKWQIKMEIYLTFFSFQKFIMYKDIETNAKKIGSHPLIRQIILRTGSSIHNYLPEEIRQTDLDKEFAPEKTAQITNADSSQLRAIMAVSRNHSIVIEGPPGTGKSQTITNLIAQALSENRTVLFVAEKMAALEVVYSRLVDAGLGEFCLELHSTKANKRAVMKEIAASLDASLQRTAKREASAARIGAVRDLLSAYTQAVHTPYGELKMAPYQAYGELEKVRNAPKFTLNRSIDNVTQDVLANTERDLRELVNAGQYIGIPANHPWRDTTHTYYSEQDLDQIEALLKALIEKFSNIVVLIDQVEQSFNLPPIYRFTDIETAVHIADVLSRSPGAPLAVLQNEAWNSPPRQALDLVSHGRRFQEFSKSIEEKFTRDILNDDHSEDIVYIEAKENSLFRYLNFLSGKFRAIKARWLRYRLSSYNASLLEQATDMRTINSLKEEQRYLNSNNAQAEQLFGTLWDGEHSNWDALEGYIKWVTEFRNICITNKLKEQAIAVATKSHPDISLIKQLKGESEVVKVELNSLQALIGWNSEYLSPYSIKEVFDRIKALHEHIQLAPRWAAFEMTRVKVEGGIASELLNPAMKGELKIADLPDAFRRAFFQKWINKAVQERKPLSNFSTPIHEERVEEFNKLDEQILLDNRVNLVNSLRDRVQTALQASEVAEALPFLRRQLRIQKGLSPLRTIFQRSFPAIRAIKPVFMMSPLSVAQLLDSKHPPFDLIIFDEASQLPTEDAIGAIARGKQLVVVGDPKQLPPTNFFSMMIGAVNEKTDEDGIPIFDDTESILDEFMASGAPVTRLKWHYRSAHESLINFSNVSFYDGNLYTFPSVETDAHTSGLSFEYVEEGVYQGSGLNLQEARRVADAVVHHAKSYPELSLGVGTFNLRQQLAIQDELEQRRRNDPSLESFFSQEKKEPFFVKNLENIQGDERDMIFLSVTYGKDANGNLRYNFGPLNRETGWRRLNVLTTRAREGMRVFSSIKGKDLNTTHLKTRGPKLLREFLSYAETGHLDSEVVNTLAKTESPFEDEVYQELTARGIKLQPQVGVAGYRIDLGVIDDTFPGRYICGIECDGASYHSSETARDRDRLRQRELERRGWIIHRLWSTDWFKDRLNQINRLLALIEKSRSEIETKQRVNKRLPISMETNSIGDERIDTQVSLSSSEEIEINMEIQAEKYRLAPVQGLHFGMDIAESPTSLIENIIENIVAVEAPLHIDDLVSRVASCLECTRVTVKVSKQVSDLVKNLSRKRKLSVRDQFIFKYEQNQVVVRSRAGTRIPAERIAPEEYQEAILMILRNRDSVDRRDLINTVRALLGFGRTGTNLESSINAAIEDLLNRRVIGEGSLGLKLIPL
jgi:very-short-patch-repair endonuclease/DNA polymerase III delta prime subunit